jgi:hypothetical protein
MTGADRYVLLYATIHEVMRAEKLLTRAELWRDLIPTPRQLSSDCGMALELRAADLALAREILAAAGLPPRVYRMRGGAFEPAE